MDFVSEEDLFQAKESEMYGLGPIWEENLLPKEMKQKLEDGNSDSSPEKKKRKLEDDDSSSSSSDPSPIDLRNESDMKMCCLEPILEENLLPEEKKQKLKDSNSDSSPEKKKQKLEDDSSSSSHSSPIDLRNEFGEGRLILTEEERLNIVFDPADYSDPEERERDIRTFYEDLREDLREMEARRLTKKKQNELPKEKLKSHGWFGLVMAEDFDDYSNAEERVEDLLKYADQVKASRGFDVGSFPKARLCGMIVPVEVKGSGSLEDHPLLAELSSSAIKKFNQEKGRQYTFERVIKSTARLCAGTVFYITFEATEFDSLEIFEASVFWKIDDDVEVMTINPQATIEFRPYSRLSRGLTSEGSSFKSSGDLKGKGI